MTNTKKNRPLKSKDGSSSMAFRIRRMTTSNFLPRPTCVTTHRSKPRSPMKPPATIGRERPATSRATSTIKREDCCISTSRASSTTARPSPSSESRLWTTRRIPPHFRSTTICNLNRSPKRTMAKTKVLASNALSTRRQWNGDHYPLCCAAGETL